MWTEFIIFEGNRTELRPYRSERLMFSLQRFSCISRLSQNVERTITNDSPSESKEFHFCSGLSSAFFLVRCFERRATCMHRRHPLQGDNALKSPKPGTVPPIFDSQNPGYLNVPSNLHPPPPPQSLYETALCFQLPSGIWVQLQSDSMMITLQRNMFYVASS